MALDKYPISGGPKKKPTIPYVESIEIAIPGAYFFERPAKLNVSGNIEDVPKPTKQNPNIDDQKNGKITAISMPAVINMELII